MAGLLDQYMLAGNDMALTVVLDMADWAVARVDVSQRPWQCYLSAPAMLKWFYCVVLGSTFRHTPTHAQL
jgi:hypothetical protein